MENILIALGDVTSYNFWRRQKRKTHLYGRLENMKCQNSELEPEYSEYPEYTEWPKNDELKKIN